MSGFLKLIRQMAPAAATICHGAAAHYAAVGVCAGNGFHFIVRTEGIALLHGVAHQAVFVGEIALQPLVLVVFVLAAVLAPVTLLENDHRKAGHRQLLGHDAAGGSRTDDNVVDFG